MRALTHTLFLSQLCHIRQNSTVSSQKVYAKGETDQEKLLSLSALNSCAEKGTESSGFSFTIPKLFVKDEVLPEEIERTLCAKRAILSLAAYSMAENRSFVARSDDIGYLGWADFIDMSREIRTKGASAIVIPNGLMFLPAIVASPDLATTLAISFFESSFSYYGLILFFTWWQYREYNE